MCSRAIDLIPILMERIEKLEAKKVALIELKNKYRKWNLVLIFISFGLIFFCKYQNYLQDLSIHVWTRSMNIVKH